jgi:2-iminoacetate synthase ThiH
MAEAGMVQMIREAGRIPVQRDALYRVIREYPARESEAPARAAGAAVASA